MKSFIEHSLKKIEGTFVSDKYKGQVDDIIKLSISIQPEEISVAKLVKINKDVQTKEGMLGDLLEKPNKAFKKRVEDADLNYPILVQTDYYIIDGAHRLAKAYFSKQKSIQVKIIPNEVLKQATSLT
jgi:hypothetical protein